MTVCYSSPTTTPTTPYLFPGETCESNSQCLGLGECENKACKGTAEQGVCRTSDDCGVGLYCKDKTCQTLIAVDGACSGSGECVQYAKCNQSKCVEYFSLQQGEVAESADMCASYRIVQGKCAEAIKLTNPGRVGEKAVPNVCKYETVGGVAESEQKSSVCGMAEVPSAYCPIQSGDPAFQQLLNTVSVGLTTGEELRGSEGYIMPCQRGSFVRDTEGEQSAGLLLVHETREFQRALHSNAGQP